MNQLALGYAYAALNSCSPFLCVCVCVWCKLKEKNVAVLGKLTKSEAGLVASTVGALMVPLAYLCL